MRILVAISSCIVLASCAGTPAPNYAPITTAVSFPKVGVETEASLGEDMLRQGFYTETDGVEIHQENNIKGYKLSAGFYPKISEDKDSTYHSYQNSRTRDGAGYIASATDFLGLPLSVPQSIRFSKNRQQTCVILGGIFAPSCDTQHSYTRVRRPMLSERDFQQTLIYSGRVGNKIRIGYRESSGDYARPAFSNEAEYDLSSSSEIAYRGARIKVIEADNLKIKYVVLTNFNSPK